MYIGLFKAPDQNHLDYQKDSGDAEDNNDSLKEGEEPEEESLEGNTCFKHFTDKTEL